MKQLYLILFLLLPAVFYTQITDTIKLPYKKAVVLVFDDEPKFESGFSAISPSVLPGDNKLVLRYAYSQETEFETNLFVQSGDDFYMFIIIHDEKPKKFIYNYQSHVVNKPLKSSMINPKQHMVVNKNLSLDTLKKVFLNNNKTEFFDYATSEKKKKVQITKYKRDSALNSNCRFVIYEPREILNKGVKGKGRCSLILSNIFVHDDNLYFQINLQNKSKISYELSSFKMFLTPKNNKIKNSVVSDEEIELIYFFNESSNRVIGKTTKEFVLVTNKITLENDKKIDVVATEKGGERTMKFSIFSEDLYNLNTIIE